MKRMVSNWGKYPVIEANENGFKFQEEAIKLVNSNSSLIARGNGRCYGDASLNSNIISTLNYNNILSFDAEKGIINCQSGIILDQILTFIIPYGWFLPVTPGTKFITIGGALASDVHGKNHHKEGTFADHVIHFKIIVGSGEEVVVRADSNSELFKATAGGMGLTGVITEISFQLKPIKSTKIAQTKIKAENLFEAMEIFEENKGATYSMAWIDCLNDNRKLGRSLIMLGEHSDEEWNEKLVADQKQLLNMPINLPACALNNLTIKIFNWLYYNKEFKKIQKSNMRYDPFFYPLDSITNWNRMYGKPGFVQYQFVLPMSSSRKGMEQILKRISNKGMGSFLAVLKLFGSENNNYLSFPREGYTLALDFPVKSKLFPFLNELDKMVLDFGGRIYLSKDARMDEQIFRHSYPRLEEFLNVVKNYNPGKFKSLQSDRLFKNLV